MESSCWGKPDVKDPFSLSCGTFEGIYMWTRWMHIQKSTRSAVGWNLRGWNGHGEVVGLTSVRHRLLRGWSRDPSLSKPQFPHP